MNQTVQQEMRDHGQPGQQRNAALASEQPHERPQDGAPQQIRKQAVGPREREQDVMFRCVIGRVLVTLPTKENEPAEEKIARKAEKIRRPALRRGLTDSSPRPRAT